MLAAGQGRADHEAPARRIGGRDDFADLGVIQRADRVDVYFQRSTGLDTAGEILRHQQLNPQCILVK